MTLQARLTRMEHLEGRLNPARQRRFCRLVASDAEEEAACQEIAEQGYDPDRDLTSGDRRMRNLSDRVSKMELKQKPKKLRIEVFITGDEDWQRRPVGDDVIEVVIGGHDTPSKAVSADG